MSRTFQITKRVFFVLSILLFLTIPVASLIWTAFVWDGYCLFGASCPWWEAALLMMPGISTYFIPFLVATSLVWIVMSVVQFFITSKSQKAKTLLRYVLLGVFTTLITFIAYQVGWNIFVKIPVEESVDYKLPAAYYRVYSQYTGVMHVVINKSKHNISGIDIPAILIASTRSYINVDKEKIRLRIQSSVDTYYYETKLVDEQEVTIRGQKVSLFIYEGTDENGVHIKQVVSGFFEGKKNSKVMLFITGNVAHWNQKEIDAFIKSIK